MRTLTEKYNGVLNETFSKAQFVRDARMALPNLITQFNGFEDAVAILKSKGMIFEAKKEEYTPAPNYSLDALDSAIQYELTLMNGDDNNFTEEQALKAKAKAEKNLAKNANHYINLISGESKHVNKHDKEVEVKRGAAEKDVFNGMKKAELRESKRAMMKEELSSIINQAKSYAASKWPELSDKDVMDFVRMHGKEVMDGDDLEASFDNYVYANWDLDENTLKEAIKNIIRKTLTEQEVEEISRDAYERIDGLTSQPLLAQLLDTAKAIYNDQIEAGDLFDAEDVSEYLANEIYKELAKIESASELEEGKKVERSEGGKTLKEEDYDTGGYVESMHPDHLEPAIEHLKAAWEDWKKGPMTEPGMIPHAKKDLLSYISNILD